MDQSICRLSLGYRSNLKDRGSYWQKDKRSNICFFDEVFNNKSSEELLKSLANNSDQESDIETDTDSDSNDPEPTPQI